MESLPFFMGACDFSKKNSSSFLLFVAQKNLKIFLKSKNSFKNGFPALFYGGRIPKKCVIFPNNFFSVVPASRRPKFSKSPQAKKNSNKFFVKFEKFQHI